jgi:predicted permease
MGTLLRRIRYLLRYRRQQDDLADELEFHREMKQRQLERDGMHPVAAAAAARRALGNPLSVGQYARDVWLPPLWREVAMDVRFALRWLRRDRSFCFTAVIVLGLGMGVNNMMFTLIYSHTMRGLPMDRAERVLYISAMDDRASDRPLSYPELVDLQSASTFQGVAAFASAPMTVGDPGRAPDRFEGAYVTANAMDVIGRRPVLGRPFTAADDRRGTTPVAILGSEAWRARYQSDPRVLGRTILVNGAPATVVGVMPARSGFPMSAEVWLPLSQMSELESQGAAARVLRVFGRMRDGVDEAAARSEIEAMFDRAARGSAETGARLRARVSPINARFLGRATDPAWLAFLTASFIVLLVSAANVANLMIARTAERTRELAIRATLGAGRWRIVEQMVTESVVLAAVGGVIAIGVSLVGVRAFRSAIPDNTLPYWLDYRMDARVLGALLAVGSLTVLVFGLVPAIQSSRTDVNRALKDGGRTGTGKGSARRWTTVFLTAEFALTVVLLVNAVMAIRSRAPRVPSDPIVRTTQLITASITLPAAAYAGDEQRMAFYARLDERLRAVPEIAGVSVTSVLPSRLASEQRLDVEARERGAGERAPTVAVVAIAPTYFETLTLPMQRGREFDDNDGEPGRQHVIVNQRFVETFLPDGNPLGRRISLTAPAADTSARVWLTIVGVAPDIRQQPAPTANPVAYVPLHAAPPATASLIVRSAAGATTLTARLREELRAIDPNLPLYRVATMAKAIDDAEWNGRVATRLIFSITLVVLGLSIVGLSAVTTHGVVQRTQEIGIRMALGARPWQVRWLVVRRALVQVAIGLAAGVLCTLAWDAVLYSGDPNPRLTTGNNLLPASAVLCLTVLLACLLPARRATRLDPVKALRAD